MCSCANLWQSFGQVPGCIINSQIRGLDEVTMATDFTWSRQLLFFPSMLRHVKVFPLGKVDILQDVKTIVAAI